MTAYCVFHVKHYLKFKKQTRKARTVHKKMFHMKHCKVKTILL